MCLSFRVINAGKSSLNEDQACCEVVELRKRPADHSSPSYTPTSSRRRSSLPTTDVLDTVDNTVRGFQLYLLIYYSEYSIKKKNHALCIKVLKLTEMLESKRIVIVYFMS